YLVGELEVGLVVEGTDGHHVLPALDEPVEQIRAAMLAEAPLAPFRRVIAADVLGAFEAHVRTAVDRKQRPTRPAATHRTVADANLVLGILDGEAHGAAKAGAGFFQSI